MSEDSPAVRSGAAMLLRARHLTRRERVFGFTLIELLVSMLFIVMGGLLASRGELESASIELNPLREKAARLETENIRFAATIRQLEADLKERELSILRLWNKWTGEPMPADPTARKTLIDRIVEASKVDDAVQPTGDEKARPDALDLLKDTRTRTYPAGAPPACQAISGLLFRIELRTGPENLGAAFVEPGWSADEDGLAREILGPGFSMIGEQPSLARFIAAIAEADRWASRQEVRCRFRLYADNESNDLYSVALYKRQMRALRTLFYVATP